MAAYGYTADRGRTYPFRGKGVGLIPTLNDVVTAFPGRQFLINIKSNDPSEVDRLLAYLLKHGQPIDQKLWVFADGRPVERLLKLAPHAIIMSRQRGKACALAYLAAGWSGHLPAACRQNLFAVPVNLRTLYWGWPNRVLARMGAVGTPVLLVGPVGNGGPLSVADPSQLNDLLANFPGVIMTDEIEVIGPAVQQRWRQATLSSTRDAVQPDERSASGFLRSELTPKSD